MISSNYMDSNMGNVSAAISRALLCLLLYVVSTANHMTESNYYS